MTERVDFILAIKEYFPGANTPDGFCSYYSHILKPHEVKRKVILKGGPGTGKSSLMKKTAEKAASLGLGTELLHCSSDPASLDGVCIRELGFLITDGTSPHVIDPALPGAADEIINLGDFWNEDKIKPHRADIEKLSNDISAEFAGVYRYMKAAQIIENQIKSYSECNEEFVYEELEATKKELGISKVCCGGKYRNGFLTAHTHLGKVSFADSFASDAKNIIRIVPDVSGGWEKYMNKLSDMLVMSGLSVRVFFDSMNPGSVCEHLYVEDEDIFITTAKSVSDSKKCLKTINFDLHSPKMPYSADAEDDIYLHDTLMKKSTLMLKNAKKLHDELEKYYIPHMNFEMMDAVSEKIFKMIE